MSSSTIKSFVLATIKPFILSLKNYFNQETQVTRARVDSQHGAVSELQTHLAKIDEQLTKTYNAVQSYHADVLEIQSKLFTSEQVLALEARERELVFICSKLHDIVKEIQETGSSDIPLPDIDHYLWTDLEVLAEFRSSTGITDDPLTSEQEQAFYTYWKNFFTNHPEYMRDTSKDTYDFSNVVTD